MLKKLFTTTIIVALVATMIPHFVSADCSAFDPNQTYTHAQLQDLLNQCNADIAQTQSQLAAQQSTSQSISSDVNLLAGLIKKEKQQISVKNQIITELGSQIGQKQQTIQTLSQKLDAENQSLAQILRKKNEIDTMTFTEMLLSTNRISDFFLDVDNFNDVNKQLQESENTIKGIRTDTTNEKAALEAQQTQQANLRNQIQAQQVQTQEQEQEKAALLAQSKNQEKTYQQLLAKKQAAAATISAKLFNLAGGSKAIPFGDAYNYAKVASAATGVRPAFILAILKQESDLGVDQGGCYVTDLSTGAGVRASNGVAIATVMKAPRDTVPFQQILTDAGLTLANTQVSCPEKVSGAYMGYGGAMGPTQFIPSTWIMYSARIAAALNEPTSNPWNPQDAVMATALYMRDLGAEDPSQEKTAACEYYSGHGCRGYASNYGASVIKLEASIQSDINVIDAAAAP